MLMMTIELAAAADDGGGGRVERALARFGQGGIERGFFQVEDVVGHGSVAACLALVLFADADDMFEQLHALARGEGGDTVVHAQLHGGRGNGFDPLRVGAGKRGAAQVEISAVQQVSHLGVQLGIAGDSGARNATKRNGEILHSTLLA